MAIQVFQPRGVGQNIGESLGTGLGRGLEFLAQNKLENMQRQNQLARTQNTFGKLPGISPEGASFLAELGQVNPKLQELILSNPESLSQLFPSNFQPKSNEVFPNAATPDSHKIADAFTSPQQKLQQEKVNLQRISTFRPELNKIEEIARPQELMNRYAEKALKQVDKALTGLKGKITPKYLQTSEGQRLVQLLNKVVIESAKTGRGLPTRARLMLEQGAKAQTWQRPEVIKEILNDIITDPTANLDIARNEARRDLLKKYQGKYPDDILSLIEEQAEQKVAQKYKSLKESINESDLPQAQSLVNGTVARNPYNDEIEYVVNNGKWEKYNG